MTNYSDWTAEGSLPYSHTIRAAVLAERERCAKIVESYIRGYKGELIAAEIRKEPA